MARKNRRNKNEYIRELGFDAAKYTKPRRGNRRSNSHKPDLETVTPVGFTQESLGIPHYHNRTEETDRLIRRGEVWFAELGSHYGTSVQGGCRPVIVVSNNTANEFSRTLTVIPMTTKLKKDAMPTHVLLTAEHLTRRDEARQFSDSMILGEQVTTISKAQLVSYLGFVSDRDKLSEVSKILTCQLGLK